jgi:hypothetical protein
VYACSYCTSHEGVTLARKEEHMVVQKAWHLVIDMPLLELHLGGWSRVSGQKRKRVILIRNW